MTRRFAVVHEAAADFHTATELADRVLVEAIDWLEDDLLAAQRTWLDHTADSRKLTWTGIARLAREKGIRARGHFDNKPGLPDAAAARRAILFLLETISEPGAIVLVRDEDNETARRQGLEQARSSDESGIAIVIGLGIVERESWVISGFRPKDETERALLAIERQKLGFDPTQRSHDLTACKDDNATRSPKRVLRELTQGQQTRERNCWLETPLDSLRQSGAENGLATFLEEVRDHLAPLIGHSPGNA